MFEIDSPIMKDGIIITIISFVYVLATKCLIRNNNKQTIVTKSIIVFQRNLYLEYCFIIRQTFNIYLKPKF